MDILIEIDPEDGTAIAKCFGALTVDDARLALSTLWENRSWLGRSVIWDFRSSEFEMSSSDVRSVAEFLLQYQPDPPPSKVAFVTNSDVDFGLARMFSVFRKVPATKFRVFRDYDQASSWTRPGKIPEQS